MRKAVSFASGWRSRLGSGRDQIARVSENEGPGRLHLRDPERGGIAVRKGGGERWVSKLHGRAATNEAFVQCNMKARGH